MFFRKQPRQLMVYCDGGIGEHRRGTGLGVVIRDARDDIIGLVKRSMPPMTNNEAEYAALVRTYSLSLPEIGVFHLGSSHGEGWHRITFAPLSYDFS